MKPLAYLTRAARYLVRVDEDFCAGGCGDVSLVMVELCRRAGVPADLTGGTARVRGFRGPFTHVWVSVEGVDFDPMEAGFQKQYRRTRSGSGAGAGAVALHCNIDDEEVAARADEVEAALGRMKPDA